MKRRFYCTQEAIAAACGLSVDGVYRAVKRGDLDPEDLMSVALFVVRHELKKRIKKRGEDET